MPPLKEKPDITRRPPKAFLPSRRHDHKDKNANHEYDRLYKQIQQLQTRLRASLDSDGMIVNSTGSVLAPGSLLGWDSSGDLSLADASSTTLVRPVIVSPNKSVGVNERFKPLGTGQYAKVATDGAGTFVEGDRLFCSATEGISTLTAPTSPNAVYCVGYVAGDLDTTTNMIDARLNLGFGTTINASGILFQDPNDPFDNVSSGNITATPDGTDRSLIDAISWGTVGANTNMTWYGTQTYPLLSANTIPHISGSGVLTTDSDGPFFDATNNVTIFGPYVSTPISGIFYPKTRLRSNNGALLSVETASNAPSSGAYHLWIRSGGTLSSPTDVSDGDLIGQDTYFGYYTDGGFNLTNYLSIQYEVADAANGVGLARYQYKNGQDTLLISDGSLQLLVGDSGTGDFSAAGNITATGSLNGDSGAITNAITVADDPYAAGWDGSFEVPTKNAVYDKIESLSTSSSDTSYAVAFAMMGG